MNEVDPSGPRFLRCWVLLKWSAWSPRVADWTCRVLVGGLKPAQVYWYRFRDKDGNGSRVGPTRTAPSPDGPRPVSFCFRELPGGRAELKGQVIEGNAQFSI